MEEGRRRTKEREWEKKRKIRRVVNKWRVVGEERRDIEGSGDKGNGKGGSR